MASASSCKKLYLEKDFKLFLESRTFAVAECQTLQRPLIITTLRFGKAIQNINSNPKNSSIKGFTVVNDILQEYAKNDRNRKFVSIFISNLCTSWENNTWKLAYYAEFNENVLRSLCASNFNKVCISLETIVEEPRLEKWCKWNSLWFAHDFELSLPQAKWTVSEDQTISTKNCFLDKSEAEIVDLIRHGKQNLRIKLEMNIWLERDTPMYIPKASIRPHPMKLTEPFVLQAMYEQDATKDLQIILGDEVELKAHKCILAAHSEVFEAMLTTKMKEEKSGVIYIEDMSEVGMKELLRYFYGMEIPTLDLNCEVASELFQAAHKYKLKQLEHAAMSLLLFRDEKWFTVDTALELYYFTRNMEAKTLNDHLLKILSRIPSEELRASQNFKELSSSDVVDLTFKLNDMLRLV